MSYKISSEKIEHPLLKPLLEELIPFFEKEGVKFFVIGATARDIILEINGEQSGRRTQDIDIAITIDKWEKFKEISEELNTTKRTIERNIMILKEMHLIERIGSRKSGYWKINIDKLGK